MSSVGLQQVCLIHLIKTLPQSDLTTVMEASKMRCCLVGYHFPHSLPLPLLPPSLQFFGRSPYSTPSKQRGYCGHQCVWHKEQKVWCQILHAEELIPSAPLPHPFFDF